MTVAKKLALLPLAALVGILVLASVLLRDISAVYRSASYASEHTVPSLEVLQKMDSNFVGERLNVWQHVATPDIAGMDVAEKQMAGRRAKVEEAIKQYEPLIADDQDRTMFATDCAAVAYYDTVKTKILGLSRDGRKADAIAALMAVKKEVTTAGNQLSEHIAYLVTLSAARRAEAQATQRSAIRWGILLTVSTLILVVGLGVVIYRQLTRQLGGEPADVARVADRVAQGDFSSPISLRSGDSTSLYASVAKMQRDLEARAAADRARLEAESARSAAELAAAVENSRIRTALDRVSAGVMLVDSAGTIIYANDFVVAMLQAQVNEIRVQAPRFDPAALLGSNIESLLPGVTAQPSGHTTQRSMGRACFRVIATQVVDTRGAKVGTAVQWIDRTEEVAVEQEVATMVANAAAGDLRVRLGEAGKDGFFKVLAAGINQLLVSVTDVVRTIGQAAAEVSTGADEISRGNLDLSQRTEQQASSLEETAASMDQMTSMVKSNADNAAQANQLAAAARQQAERGGQVVSAAVAAMSEINGASRKIADIIGVIDDIAFQTNLLALNAAVEAARAGEQGRGFAVVASEVRNLASRSADAAKQIKGLIQDSVTKVADGARLVDESGRVLGDIVTGVKKVTEVMAEIAASSMEQASGIEKVNQAVTSMDSATQQNAALVEEASAAAQTLTAQAARLSELIARYRIDGQPPAAAPRPDAALVAPPRTSGAPAVERRGPNRPFSGKSSGGRSGAVVAADAEAGWQEF